MTTNPKIRVRFAPSPTGLMHLGNIRAAVLNYLYAKKYNGTFILRIEDTDPERNFDPQAKQIIEDLTWLHLRYEEGPEINGPHAPYFQSQRTLIYQQKLEELNGKNLIYRCFCTPEELEQRRKQQLALKLPPRYDRRCLKLSTEHILKNIQDGMPFIWRLKVMQDKEVIIKDLAHGTMKFNLKDISDLPLTRKDGSFTFIFANCIDDIVMQISTVIRGEDHLTNTAGQVVLYDAFNTQLPTFWHLPIMVNTEGKKLSKRDFGFSLNDLKQAGFLPEAIDNYLAIIGGSFEQEILSLDDLAQIFNFEHMHSTGHITYDVEKLRWMNHKWIARLSLDELVERCLPFLLATYPQARNVSPTQLGSLISAIRTDLVTLVDVTKQLHFFFAQPVLTKKELEASISADKMQVILQLLKHLLAFVGSPDYLEQLKRNAKDQGVSMKELFWTLRYALTGSTEGLGIKELLDLLGHEEARKRIESFLIAP